MGKTLTQKRRREAEADQERRHETDGATQEGAATTTAPPSKKARVEERRSLFIRSLPPSATSESLTDFFSEHFPVKHALVVVDPKTKVSRGYGFVTFTDAEDAAEAKAKLDNELLDGRRLRLEIAEPRQRPSGAKGAAAGAAAGASGGTAPPANAARKQQREEELAEARKAPKLIVRNLPWSVKTSEDLTALFRMYGKVKFADLPSSKGKLSGFGFVTLRGRKNAEKAMAEVNGKEVDGRTLAVDWAVDKGTWKQKQDEEEEKNKESDENEDEDEDEDEAKEKKPKTAEELEAEEDLRNFMKNNMENLEEEDDSEDEKAKKDKKKSKKSSDDDDDDDEEEAEEEKPKKVLSTDNSTTLFVRNLPFTATDASLKSHFGQFGAVRYARIVVDRATDRPAGTGFVCFFNKDDAMLCLQSAPRRYKNKDGSSTAAALQDKTSVLQDDTADLDGRYTLEGRVLQVAQAVSKAEATQLYVDGPASQRARDRDKRRLFLLSEGTIAANSPMYAVLPPNEIEMREASAKQRQTLVKTNPALHLSLTRLAIRNIPRHIDSKALKELARQAIVGFARDVKAGVRAPLSKEELSRGGQQDREAEQRRRAKGKGVVRQAKVVFETKDGTKLADDTKSAAAKRVGGAGAGVEGGRSRGYGFIEYWSHRWALTALRWLNGHAVQTESGKTQRLIVEFAIENANVVARRRLNEERVWKGKNKKEGEGEGAEYDGNEDDGDRRGRNGKQAKGKKGKFGKDRDATDATDAKVANAFKDKSTKGKKGSKDRKGADADAGKEMPSTKQAKADAKLAMRQQIIGRKRLMRKKKAVVRKGK